MFVHKKPKDLHSIHSFEIFRNCLKFWIEWTLGVSEIVTFVWMQTNGTCWCFIFYSIIYSIHACLVAFVSGFVYECIVLSSFSIGIQQSQTPSSGHIFYGRAHYDLLTKYQILQRKSLCALSLCTPGESFVLRHMPHVVIVYSINSITVTAHSLMLYSHIIWWLIANLWDRTIYNNLQYVHYCHSIEGDLDELIWMSKMFFFILSLNDSLSS